MAKLRLLGPLQAYVDGRKEINIDSGRTVHDTLVSLNIPPEAIALVTVNEEIQKKDYLVQEGDIVRILAIIGGG